jgi:hypothetical protein
MDASVVELVGFLQAVNSGSLIGYVILLAFVLIVFDLVIAAVQYQHLRIKRFKAASKAAQENFEAIAVKLRKRALEMKEGDDELRKCELKIKECDEPNPFLKDTNAEVRSKPERSQQQQVLKELQQILKQGVSHAVTLGLKDNQNQLLQIDLTGILSAVQRKRKGAA